jgi:hypothetical protein
MTTGLLVILSIFLISDQHYVIRLSLMSVNSETDTIQMQL